MPYGFAAFAGCVDSGVAVAGGADCCDAGATGWVLIGAAGVRLSNIVADGFRPAKYPRANEVTMNTIAMPVVKRVRKLPAPLLPKIVELSPMLTMTCMIVTAIIIKPLLL